MGAKVFRERFVRGHLHPSQQTITQQGRGLIQVTLSVWPDFGIKCPKGHWLLTGLPVSRRRSKGSTKNLRCVKYCVEIMSSKTRFNLFAYSRWLHVQVHATLSQNLVWLWQSVIIAGSFWWYAIKLSVHVQISVHV